jgi:outer membrane protein OmpA-like peptidoglycan-associated protein
MRCNWRRWLWGVIPLVGISVAAVHLERRAIEKDLTERAERVLTKNGERWAVVNFSGRDVILTGNATSENEPHEAEAVLRRLWGVRHVNNNANLPPKVEPFVWSARRRGDRVRLFGYVPDRATRQAIIGMSNATLPGLEVVDRMRAARGVPPHDTWLAGLSFALKQLASLKQGEVRLDDLALTISGEAENAVDYRTVTAALKRGLPKGITLASAQVTAPVVSPYTWSAQFAGGQLVLSGYVASDAAKAEMQAAAPPGIDVVDRLEPAGGAPPDFAAAAAALIKQVVKLQSGNTEIKDTLVTVGGVAADDAQARAVRDGLRGALPAGFRLTDQIRVREAPKIELKPPAEPPAPAPAQQHAVKEAAPAAPPVEPQPKTATAAPVPAETRPPEATPAPAAAPVPDPAPPAPIPPPPAVAVPPIDAQLAACRDDLSKLAVANPITFERGSAEIEAAGREVLARIAAAVKGCPGVRIAAEGHADVEGLHDYNQRLSVKRAQAVTDYLIAAGVSADQVETAGFGASRPVAPNSTPGARAKNRRTEIVVRVK